jgi:hypothetical protein
VDLVPCFGRFQRRAMRVSTKPRRCRMILSEPTSNPKTSSTFRGRARTAFLPLPQSFDHIRIERGAAKSEDAVGVQFSSVHESVHGVPDHSTFSKNRAGAFV